MVNIKGIGLRRKNNRKNKRNRNEKISGSITSSAKFSPSSLPYQHDYRTHRSVSTRFLSIALILILASSAAITPYNGSAIFNGIFSIFSLFNQAYATPGITYPILPVVDPNTVCTEADLFTIDPNTGQPTGNPQPFPVTFGDEPNTFERYQYKIAFGATGPPSPEQQALFDQGLIIMANFAPTDTYDTLFDPQTGAREEAFTTGIINATQQPVQFMPFHETVKPGNGAIIARSFVQPNPSDPNDPNMQFLSQLKAGVVSEGEIAARMFAPNPAATYTLTNLKFCAGNPMQQGGPDTFYSSSGLSHATGPIQLGSTIEIPEDSAGSGSATFSWTVAATNYQLKDSLSNNPNGVLPYDWIMCDPGSGPATPTDISNPPDGIPDAVFDHTFTVTGSPQEPQNTFQVTCDVGTEPNAQFPSGAAYELGQSKFTFNVRVVPAAQQPQPTLAGQTENDGVYVSGSNYVFPNNYWIVLSKANNPDVGRTVGPNANGDISFNFPLFQRADLEAEGFFYQQGEQLTLRAYNLQQNGQPDLSNHIAITTFTATTSLSQPPPSPIPHSLIGTINVGESVRGIAVNPITGLVYVANLISDTVSVIDPAQNNAVVATVNVGVAPFKVAINPTTGLVYVSNQDSDTVSVMDPAQNNAVVATINVGDRPVGVAVNPTTGLVYVNNQGSNTVSVIDTAQNNAVVATVNVDLLPSGIAINPTNGLVYIAHTGVKDSVSVMDPAQNNAVVATVNVGNDPFEVAINPTTGLVYIPNRQSDTVSVIDPAQNNGVVATVNVGDDPLGIAINPTTGLVYVGNANSDTVSVIDPAQNNAVVATVNVGDGPIGVATNPSTGLVYVSNFRSQTVSIISRDDSQPQTPTLSGVIAPDGTIHVSGTGFAPGAPGYTIEVTNTDQPTIPPLAKTGVQADTSGEIDVTFTGDDMRAVNPDFAAASSNTLRVTATDQIENVEVASNEFVAGASLPPPQQPPTVTIASAPTPTTTPKWGIDEITVSGVALLQGADPATNRLVVDWGDNNPSEFDLSTVSPDPDGARAWSLQHTYGKDAAGPRDIVAKIVDTSTDPPTERATSDIVSVQVLRHSTSLSLKQFPDVIAKSPIIAAGTLIDTDTGEEITGEQITFTEFPLGSSSIQSPATTAGVSFTGPPDMESGLQPVNIVGCATCAKDKDVTDNDGINNVIRLFSGSKISFPQGTSLVEMFMQDMGFNTATLMISYNDNTQSQATAAGKGADVGYVAVDGREHAGGIKEIAITNINGDTGTQPHAGISLLRISDPTLPPEQQVIAEFSFENIAPGSYESPLELQKGLYFAKGQASAQPTGLAPPQVTAQFSGGEDQAYEQSISETREYTVKEDNGLGTVGEAASVNPYSAALYGAITCSVDSDNDGICDSWETAKTRDTAGKVTSVNGVPFTTSTGTTAFYDLCFEDRFSNVWSESTPTTTLTTGVKVCPVVGHKDIFVELDSMSSHAPSPIAVKRVIKAFGNVPQADLSAKTQIADHFGRTPGATMHVIVSDTTIPHLSSLNAWTDPTGDATPNNSFAELKASFLGTSTERANTNWRSGMDDAKSNVYRYVLFVHGYGSTCSPSGIAEVVGNDAIVALGCAFAETNANHAGTEGSPDEQAGTLMHEIGHNLGLDHGGPKQLLLTEATSTAPATYSTAFTTPASPSSADTSTNCKPNYLSVMSYSRQLPVYLTGTTWQTKALDFSRDALASLNEGTSTAGQLNEAGGLTSPFASNLIYGTPDKTTKSKTAPTGTNIDWTGDGVVSTATSLKFQDINNFGIGGCGASSTGQILKGFDDWRNAKWDFKGTLASFDGVWPTVLAAANTPELTTEIVQEVKTQGNQYTGVLQPLNDDGTSIFKIGDTVNIRFSLKDADGKPITNKPVTFTAQKVSNSITGTVREAASGATPSTTNLFTVSQGPTPTYHYEWGTRGQTQGTYDLRFYIDFGKPTQELISNGKSDALGPYAVKLSLSTR